MRSGRGLFVPVARLERGRAQLQRHLPRRGQRHVGDGERSVGSHDRQRHRHLLEWDGEHVEPDLRVRQCLLLADCELDLQRQFMLGDLRRWANG